MQSCWHGVASFLSFVHWRVLGRSPVAGEFDLGKPTTPVLLCMWLQPLSFSRGTIFDGERSLLMKKSMNGCMKILVMMKAVAWGSLEEKEEDQKNPCEANDWILRPHMLAISECRLDYELIPYFVNVLRKKASPALSTEILCKKDIYWFYSHPVV